ncbi:hypothetical protein ACFUCV_09310 [Specibacter sp. NPDC057265]|uniref:hypothetical protein n=1 Tax=Specibacter sp. NPDC057265 TaxID=3346075 RepID=UPI0036280255
MLRLSPVISTPTPEAYAQLLTAVGLQGSALPGTADVPARQLFNSGNGKILLEQAPVHSIRLEFELRDAAIFVQRTVADGTPARLHGTAAQVTAADFTFLARPGADLSLPDPDSALSVTAVWTSADPAAANAVLSNIGARKLRGFPFGGALFKAKNGGFVRTAAGVRTGVELQLQAGGTGTVNHGMPDGGSLAISRN